MTLEPVYVIILWLLFTSLPGNNKIDILTNLGGKMGLKKNEKKIEKDIRMAHLIDLALRGHLFFDQVCQIWANFKLNNKKMPKISFFGFNFFADSLRLKSIIY